MTGPEAPGGERSDRPAGSRPESAAEGRPGGATPWTATVLPGPAGPPASPPVAPPATLAQPAPAPSPTPSAPPVAPPAAVARRPRRATLTITRIDPWSALKLSAGFSAALVVVIIVAVMALDALLSAMGVFSSVDAVLAKTSPGLHIGYPVVDVFLVALLIGLLDVVLLTAIGTLAAFLYNLVGDLAGGLEVTLSERD